MTPIRARLLQPLSLEIVLPSAYHHSTHYIHLCIFLHNPSAYSSICSVAFCWIWNRSLFSLGSCTEKNDTIYFICQLNLPSAMRSLSLDYGHDHEGTHWSLSLDLIFLRCYGTWKIFGHIYHGRHLNIYTVLKDWDSI